MFLWVKYCQMVLCFDEISKFYIRWNNNFSLNLRYIKLLTYSVQKYSLFLLPPSERSGEAFHSLRTLIALRVSNLCASSIKNRAIFLVYFIHALKISRHRFLVEYITCFMIWWLSTYYFNKIDKFCHIFVIYKFVLTATILIPK